MRQSNFEEGGLKDQPYRQAGDDDALAEALARNLYRGAPVDARARALTVYVRGAQAALAQGGKALDFGPLPVAGP